MGPIDGEFELVTDDDVLKRLGSGGIVDGLTELIWNAIDADARSIAIELEHNLLGGIDGVVVRDDGHGISPEVARSQFGKFGGSAKGIQVRSPGGRPLKGRQGQGRFHALWPGSSVRWESVSDDEDGRRWAIAITTSSAFPKKGVIEQPIPTAASTGTTVRIRGFSASHSKLDAPSIPAALLTNFAREIRSHTLTITFADQPLDPSTMIVREWERPLGETAGYPATLEVLEWNSPKVGRKLYLTAADGSILQEERPGVNHRGFVYTAYLRWQGFETNSEDLALGDLAIGPTSQVIEDARRELRTIIRQRAADGRSRIINTWRSEGVYPYTGEAASEAEVATRETFDLVAFEAAEVIQAGKTTQSKKLALSLIKQALEQNPPALHQVLTEVLQLPSERVADLAELLNKTTLSKMIQATRTITDRLDFVSSLALMTTASDWKRRIKERSQLHKILETETWIFGDEYTLTRSDQSLNNVLKAHIEEMGREQLEGLAADEVLDTDGKRRVVDLMLTRAVQIQNDRLKHLVIELKRPSVRIGPSELQQAKNYAEAIVSNKGFDKARTEWEVWVVSTDIKPGTVEKERFQHEGQPGLAYWDPGKVKVYVRTWAEILHDARRRLEFVRDQLDYDPSEQQTLDWLHKRHARYLPEVEPLAPEPEDVPARP